MDKQTERRQAKQLEGAARAALYKHLRECELCEHAWEQMCDSDFMCPVGQPRAAALAAAERHRDMLERALDLDAESELLDIAIREVYNGDQGDASQYHWELCYKGTGLPARGCRHHLAVLEPKAP